MKIALFIIAGLVGLILFCVTAKYLKRINGGVSLITSEDGIIIAVIVIVAVVSSCVSVLLFNGLPQF